MTPRPPTQPSYEAKDISFGALMGWTIFLLFLCVVCGLISYGVHRYFIDARAREVTTMSPLLEEGAIIADALTTPYHAVVQRARVRPGDWGVVVGCGGSDAGPVPLALRADRGAGPRLCGAPVFPLGMDGASQGPY